MAKIWDMKAWNKCKDVKEVLIARIFAFIAGIIIGLAISQFI
jgi:hypothetical protein